MSMADPLVDVVGLAKRYAGTPVVRDVTLTLRAGEIVGLVGANGGGKTTTLRMIAGLVRADAGSGTVLGQPIGAADARQRRQIGYMGQKIALYPDLTVIETLRFHAAVHGIAGSSAVIEAALDRYGIGKVARQGCATLSGGWARRMQFAATALAEPRLLLLDEPTAGLDVATRRDIWRWMEEFARAGHGIVISTHDLAEAEQCPSILLYHGGIAGPQSMPRDIAAAEGARSLEAAVLSIVDRTA